MPTEIGLMIRALKRELEVLGNLIMATPTGSTRNALCDAQIHLMECICNLERAE